MHAVTFQFKRAHWQGVAFGKKVVADIEHMTPARFDLLYAIRRPWGRWCAAGYAHSQKTVRKQLGLHRTTVSKMIARLKEIGWVTNDEKDLSDTRTKLVRLTAEGTRVIEKAMRIVFRQRTHLKFFEDFFKRWAAGTHVLEAIDEFWWTARNLGKRLGDTSTLFYCFGHEPDH